MKVHESRRPEPSTFEGFQSFAEALPCITWIAGADGTVQWCSQGFSRFTGLTSHEALGWGWMPSVHPYDQRSIAREWTSALVTGIDLDAILRLRNAEGSYRWFSIRAHRSSDASGEVVRWLGTLTDVHDRQTTLELNAHVVDALMKGYLTKTFPSVSGLKFDTHYKAANSIERLGGDWYDVFRLPDQRIAFSLGDVCGHGLDAAVKMGEAKQAIFTAACLGDPAPVRVLEHANKVIFLNGDHVSITTALYGIVDTTRRTVTYASAGHHPPILTRLNTEAEILPNHGFPLGVEEDMPPRIKTHEFTYEPGSMMVLYTDGLIEFDHDIADGESRLLAAIAKAARTNAEHPASFIANQVLQDSVPLDDVAILTISFQND